MRFQDLTCVEGVWKGAQGTTLFAQSRLRRGKARGNCPCTDPSWWPASETGSWFQMSSAAEGRSLIGSQSDSMACKRLRSTYSRRPVRDGGDRPQCLSHWQQHREGLCNDKETVGTVSPDTSQHIGSDVRPPGSTSSSVTYSQPWLGSSPSFLATTGAAHSPLLSTSPGNRLQTWRRREPNSTVSLGSPNLDGRLGPRPQAGASSEAR